MALLINTLNITSLKEKTHWMFDMDGTLTHAVHDFDKIRDDLGLPVGKPILESIADLPATEAKLMSEKLDAMEYEIAELATQQPGAEALLSVLKKNNCTLGIVTRNGFGIAKATLKACGLLNYFPDESIISRDCAAPKPAPDGVELLLSRWSAEPGSALIVGDYLFDLEAGKRAGVSTVHLDVHAKFAWPEYTDHEITSLETLAQLWE